MATKEQAKHAPGPWRSAKDYDGDHAIWDSGGKLIAVTDGWTLAGTDRPMEEDEANARLIAAAPEMLEALKIARQTMDKYDDVGWSDGAIGLIDEVIAKAEGRS